MQSVAALLILSLIIFPATFCFSAFVEKEGAAIIPEEWQVVEKSPGSTTIRLIFALSQKNLDVFEQKFTSISSPLSEDYAKYLTLEEIKSIIAPPQENIDQILQWISQFNPSDVSVSRTGDWIKATVPISTAEKMLSTNYYQFKHSSSSIQIHRISGTYSLPSEISPMIDLVAPTIHFPKVKRRVMKKESVGLGMTPSSVSKLLHIPSGTVGNVSLTNNIQSVAQFLEQYYRPGDLEDFQKMFDVPVHPVAKVIGPNNPSSPGVEASLDIEYIMGIAPGVPTWFFYTAGRHEEQEPFLEWATNLNNMQTVPFVVSVSYGDDENSITADYATRSNVEFQKLATRGISVLFASGDDGVGCQKSCSRFVPNWPASSPYVTTVGGVVEGFDGSLSGDTISSGGFSDLFSRPSYQDAAVKEYLSKSVPSNSFYNSSNRAYPDIASFSEDIAIVVDAIPTYVAGTSCAAPVVSGVIGLLNDALLSAGKTSLGFLNPLLYHLGATNPSVYTDITDGRNSDGCCTGFPCTSGWDAVTGWGLPNYENMKEAVLAMRR